MRRHSPSLSLRAALARETNSVRGIGTLGLLPSPDETEAMIHSHFESLRIKLGRELTALCPAKSAKLDGKNDCCNPVDCKIDALIMACRYIAALEAAWRVREVPFGGFWGNVGISLIGGNGLNYPEDMCAGLMCDGWRDMAMDTLQPLTGESNCWNYNDRASRNLLGRIFNFDTHAFSSLESLKGRVVLDPLPSGGWEY